MTAPFKRTSVPQPVDVDSCKILVVDDVPGNLYVIQTALEQAGAELLLAESGDAALEILMAEAEAPALAILDVQMPGMDGYELALLIRSQERLRHMPIIFLSAYFNDIESIYKGYTTGAVDCLTKPFNPAVLQAKVRVFLELKRYENRLYNSGLQQKQAEKERQAMAAAVEESEAFIRKLIDVLPGMVGYWDGNLRCQFANHAYKEWFGKTAEEMKGIHIREMQGESLFAKNEPYIRAALRGEQQHFERTITKADGSTGYTWANYIPVSDGNRTTGFFVLVTDITALKKAEEHLIAQEKFYKSTLDGINAHICVINEKGTIITTNGAWQTFSEDNNGIVEHTGVGANYFFACQPLAGEPDPQISEFTNGISAVLQGTLPEFVREYFCSTPSKDFWFACKASPFQVNGVPYAVISHEDITPRRESEIMMRKLARAVEYSASAVLIADKDEIIEYVNPMYATISGYAVEEIIGHRPSMFKSGITPPETYRALWSALRSGGTWEGELVNKRKDGTIYYEHAAISGIKDETGAITHFVAVKEDVTDKKALTEKLIVAKEQADVANRAKSEFLANMSHEIRTPMNGIIGMSSILLESALTREQREYAEIVSRSGECLLALINDILDFSKIESGKLELEQIDFNVLQILDDINRLLAYRAAESGLDLTYRIDSAVPCSVQGDPGRIRQVITNLVGNALKFTEQGSVTVHVSLESEHQGTAIVRFAIEDTGIGIPESRRAAIFAPFTQVDASTTRKYGGTGLGLSICKQLVGLMGGEIGVVSEEGRGSTFWFTARLTKQTTDEGKARQTTLEQSQGTLSPSAQKIGDLSVRILLAEDNIINQKVALHMLKTLGYTVDTVADGQQAVAALSRVTYDLVLMDCLMPIMDGFEATVVIRDQSSTVLNHDVPIIAMTANAMKEDRDKCLDLGMDDFISKPVKKDVIAALLVKWLSPAAHPLRSKTIEIDMDHPDRLKGLTVLYVEDDDVTRDQYSQFLSRMVGTLITAKDGAEGLAAYHEYHPDIIITDIKMPVMDGLAMMKQVHSHNRSLPAIVLSAYEIAEEQRHSGDFGELKHEMKPVTGSRLRLALSECAKDLPGYGIKRGETI